MPINRDEARALQLQVADELRRRIKAGEFGSGKIPSLDKLRKEYGVTEVTAHQAVRILQSEGLVTSVTGRGTFVSGHQLASATTTSDEVGALRAELRSLADRVSQIEERLKGLG